MGELERLYLDLEGKKNINTLDLSCYTFATQQEREAASMEFLAFAKSDSQISKTLNKGLLNFGMKYYIDRVNATQNIYLISRYAHLLYFLTHQKKWCELAIQNYKLIICNLASKEVNAYECYRYCTEVMSFYSEQKQIVTAEFIPVLTDLIKNANDKLKLWGLKIAEKYKVYKLNEIDFILPISNSLALSALKQKNYSICKSASESGLFFAKKNPTQYKPWLYKLYEILGDNEAQNIVKLEDSANNIAIPFLNMGILRHMMDFYEKGHCKDKFAQTMKLYNENKKELKFIPISIKQDVDSEYLKAMKDYFESKLNLRPQQLICYLVFGDKLIFLQNEKIDDIVEEIMKNKYFYKSLFKPIQVDLNGNEIPIEYNEEREKFRVINISLSRNLSFLIYVIFSAITRKIISFSKLKSFLLNNTCMGEDRKIMRVGKEFVYSWFQQIDYILKDFFRQVNLYLSGKSPDWRLIIDTLPMKFEGILRDMISIKGGVITKINSKGKTSDLLLDELLNEDKFLKIFDKDDKNLFEYVFTNKGLNVRNYVAHGFYKPIDYSLEKAILCFLCVMRLAKANITPE